MISLLKILSEIKILGQVTPEMVKELYFEVWSLLGQKKADEILDRDIFSSDSLNDFLRSQSKEKLTIFYQKLSNLIKDAL